MINTNYSTGNTGVNTSCLQAYAASNNVQTTQSVQGAATYSPDDTAVILTLSSEARSASVETYGAASSSTLKVGSRGEAVKTLETNLKELGYFMEAANGVFTYSTKQAVIAFQKAYGLEPDGIVGAKTQYAIAKALDNHNKGILTKGSRGAAVTRLQSMLQTLGYLSDKPDGKFGTNTKNAVAAFQKIYGLTPDGIVGAETKKAITTVYNRYNKGILMQGSRGDAVKTLQSNLQKLGYLSGKADGIFGAKTKQAVIEFQKTCGLNPDGIVGSATKSAIISTIRYKSKGILSIGCKGTDVQEIQTALKELGYLSGKADGVFGTKTRKAVKEFQEAQGLSVNGRVNNATKKAILNAAKKLKELPQFQGHVDLGYLSAKFESGTDCGTISSGKGDNGGKSYGLYQFAANAGTPKAFVNWLKNKNKSIYNKLNDAYNKDGCYGTNFDKAWKEVAKSDKDKFSELQYNYIKEKYYDPSVKKIKDNLNFDVTKRGYTLNAVIWSRAVQMGGCATVFERAVKGMDLDKASDEDIIRAIYKECAIVERPEEGENEILAKDAGKYNNIIGKCLKYFPSSNSENQAGIYVRLVEEEPKEALALLKKFG